MPRPTLEEIFGNAPVAPPKNRPSLEEIFGQPPATPARQEVPERMATPSAERTILDQALQGIPLFGTFTDEVSGFLGGLGARAYDKITGQQLFDDNERVTQLGKDMAARNIENELDQRPVLSVASQLGGGLAAGGVGAGTTAGKTVIQALNSGGKVARAAKAIGTGATLGAAYGSGAAKEGERGQGAIEGAIVGGAIPVAGSAIKAGFKGTKNAITGIAAREAEKLDEAVGAIKARSSQYYTQMRNAGAKIKSHKVNKIINSVDKHLASTTKLNSELHKETLSVLGDLREAAKNGDLDLEELDQFRRLLTRVSPVRGEDSYVASEAVDAIDEVIESLSAKDLTKGGQAAVDALGKARSTWAKARKVESVADIIKKAQGDPTKIKNGINTLLNNKKKSRGFTKQEIKILREASQTSTGEYLLKGLGRFGLEPKNVFLPIIGGSVATTVAGGPMGAALVGGGTVARQVNKYIARGKAERALRMLEKPKSDNEIMAQILSGR